MKIVFDHQCFLFTNYGGVSRYYLALIEKLIDMKEDVHVIAPLHQNEQLKLLPKHCVKGYRVNRLLLKPYRFSRVANDLLSPLMISRPNPDIIHETYFLPKTVISSCKARIVTIHDMTHEKFPQYFPRNDCSTNNKIKAIERADHVICVSNNTKQDLCNFLNVPSKKISVVYHGSENVTKSNSKKPFYNDRPFLLHVGGRPLYKNFIQTLKAVAISPELRKTFDIVAFGSEKFSKDEQATIRQLNLRPGSVKHIIGNDNTLNDLYCQATALVYPSLYEGFGLPILEAMKHGCPVVCVNSSSMPEVGGNAVQYFNPKSTEDLSDAIQKVVFNEDRKTELILNGYKQANLFSWQRCAKETLNVYKKVLNT
jgi:glycosyltransferase involved in cell wall biosynthesis